MAYRPVRTLKDGVFSYEAHGERTCFSHHPVSGGSVVSYLKVLDRNNVGEEFDGSLRIAEQEVPGLFQA
jgi:hypothetical protein